MLVFLEPVLRGREGRVETETLLKAIQAIIYVVDSQFDVFFDILYVQEVVTHIIVTI